MPSIHPGNTQFSLPVSCEGMFLNGHLDSLYLNFAPKKKKKKEDSWNIMIVDQGILQT
jgi:hypothetical protein